MGLRTVRVVDDSILNKRAREVKEIDDRIRELLDDMVETMNAHQGIGLAGPQVGILKRIFVMNVDENTIYKIINPEIIKKEGSEIAAEGCLSIPKFMGTVERATNVTLKYQDENGENKILEADGLLARCIQHEYDHLDGILITSKYIEEVKENEDNNEEDEETEN